MSLTEREFWTLIHGMGLGAIFLLAFAGGLAGIWSYRHEFLTVKGAQERLRRLLAGTWIMAAVAWLTVITGTYKVYPWYRAAPPQGADLQDYPRYHLLADDKLAGWHTFGMEWKEHLAWIVPILATTVAFVVLRYGRTLPENTRLRRALIALFTLAFVAAAIAGVFGALVTKAAPIH